MKLVRKTRHLSAPHQLSQTMRPQFSIACGSKTQRWEVGGSACPRAPSARKRSPKKLQEKKALVAGDNNAQLCRNTSRAGHLEKRQIDGLGGSGGSDWESAVSADSGPEASQQLNSPESKQIALRDVARQVGGRVSLNEAIKLLKAAGVFWPTHEQKLLLSRTMQDIGVANLSTSRSTITTTYSKVSGEDSCDFDPLNSDISAAEGSTREKVSDCQTGNFG